MQSLVIGAQAGLALPQFQEDLMRRRVMQIHSHVCRPRRIRTRTAWSRLATCGTTPAGGDVIRQRVFVRSRR